MPELQYDAVQAASELRDDRTRVLKWAESFAVLDRHGDIRPFRAGAHGIFHDGARFVSRTHLTICGQRPLLLGSDVTHDNALLAVDLANPDIVVDGEIKIPGDTLHLFRSALLHEGVCHQRFRITNHGNQPVQATLEVEVEADFVDIFELRGAKRARRGHIDAPKVLATALLFEYQGLDGVARRTRVTSDCKKVRFNDWGLSFAVDLAPKEITEFEVTFSCEVDAPEARPPQISYLAAKDEIAQSRKAGLKERCVIRSSNASFDAWVHRSYSDLDMLMTSTPFGPYPYAGVPWFSAPFGRDGIITAFETLWINPNVACGVLNFLAAQQADTTDVDHEAQPGKILHESREGEMAVLGEVPFRRYYGSVDSTPLFVWLAYAYYQRSADYATIQKLWPAISRAMEWIEHFGIQQSGFLEYARLGASGLLQQGWKDSNDSVFHDNGDLARSPIALCEVQAYAYQAFQSAAKLAVLMRQPERAVHWSDKATLLRAAFSDVFWCDKLGTYALALDGDQRLCRIPTSNAGHCLLTDIPTPDRARRVVQRLMGSRSFSGWGIRTLEEGASRFNPMSYHNGSVWPHDNAVIAAGMAKHGHKAAALEVFSGMFNASQSMDLNRMPELFCGFVRRSGQGPTRYPIACAPQAWAAGSVFLMLAACLGIAIDAPARQIRFNRPVLPTWLDWVELHNLPAPGAHLDLKLRRAGKDVVIEFLNKNGGMAEVLIIKSM